ncbi:MAG: bifunctional nicotinamidase/pyrazinamidase [Coriobacteriia bacterium]|nr:bifunctional nicotinamidase/pyrazinamidase [Coriobacteriia bacterium]
MEALIVVDLENDFMPFGALPVRDGDEAVPVANALMPRYGLVVATQDWHPPDHGSFASNHPGMKPGDVGKLRGEPQVMWPDHCVQNTPGASFHSGLDVEHVDHVIRKGTDPTIDSYSTFFDNRHLKSTGLEGYLRERGVTDVVLLGLATDYCVLYSTRDALQLGFGVSVVTDGCRAVDLTPGDGERALREMVERGATLVTSGEL